MVIRAQNKRGGFAKLIKRHLIQQSGISRAYGNYCQRFSFHRLLSPSFQHFPQFIQGNGLQRNRSSNKSCHAGNNLDDCADTAARKNAQESVYNCSHKQSGKTRTDNPVQPVKFQFCIFANVLSLNYSYKSLSYNKTNYLDYEYKIHYHCNVVV